MSAFRELVSSIRRRWSNIDLDVEDFAKRLDPDAPPPHVADLYLAWACTRRHPSALAELERLIVQVTASLRITAIDVDELRQQLRERLLAGEQPRIAEYSGGGSLAGWLRVVARRLALDQRRGEARRSRAERLAAPGALVDAELEILRGTYREPVNAALRAAIVELDAEQRQLLRLHYLDGVSLQQIGRIHGVDRSTASRRVADARRRLLDGVKRRLALALELTPGTVDSILRALGSRLDVSLNRLL